MNTITFSMNIVVQLFLSKTVNFVLGNAYEVTSP